MNSYPSDHACPCGRTARVWVALPDGDNVATCWPCSRHQADDARYLDSLVASLTPPAQVAVDPDRLSRAEATERFMAAKRRCLGCDRVSTPPAIGSHQKFTGHVGWVAA